MGAISSSFFQRIEKLRRAAARADAGNLVSNLPMIVPAAWLANTAYAQGDVRSNSGSWYICSTAGTSAASGGPTSTTVGTQITDNTAKWTYLGTPSITANDANAPTLTAQTTTPAGLTSYWNCVSFPNLFRVLGGYTSVYFTTNWALNTFNKSSGTAVLGCPAIEFLTDAPKFAIGFTNNVPNSVRVAVDDRYLTVDHVIPATGATPTWLIVDFSSVNGRSKVRKVRFESNEGGGLNFSGIRATANDQVWPTPAIDSVKAVFISDSLFAGSAYGPYLCGGGTARRVGNLLGWDDVWDMSTGGTGYIANASGTAYTFGQRIADTSNNATIAGADVVTFMGSTNDIGQSAGTITAAVTSAIQAVRAVNAGCIINVLGLWSLSANTPAVETAVQSGVTAANDPRTFFIPISNDASMPWVTGAWNNSNNTGSTNSGLYISDDNTHPPDIGTAYLAQRIAKAIKQNVLPVAA